jgi:hypothetical protein
LEKSEDKKRDSEIESLLRDKSELVALVSGLEAENDRLVREKEKASETNSEMVIILIKELSDK